MTLRGPSKTIVVEPIELPEEESAEAGEPGEDAPARPPEPEKEPAP